MNGSLQYVHSRLLKADTHKNLARISIYFLLVGTIDGLWPIVQEKLGSCRRCYIVAEEDHDFKVLNTQLILFVKRNAVNESQSCDCIK